MLTYSGRILRTVINSVYTRKHDYVEPYSYCGITDRGNADGDALWTIYRVETGEDGTITTTTATSVAWTDRLTATYL